MLLCLYVCVYMHTCVCCIIERYTHTVLCGCLKLTYNIQFSFCAIASHNLLKGTHVIQRRTVKVKLADRPPTSQQIKYAAYIADEDRIPNHSRSKKRAVEEPYRDRSHSIQRDRSQSGYQRLDKVHDRLGSAEEPVRFPQKPEDERHAYHQPSSSSRTVPVDTYKPSGTSDVYLPTSPKPEVQHGNVAQSTGNPWPDPFADYGRNVLRMPPLEDDRGSSDHVEVRQPVGPHPSISGGQYTNGAPHELQKPLKQIEPHPVASGNMLPNARRAPPGFHNPLTKREVGEKNRK